jgi:lipopolysaccharide transport system permease protein
MSATVDQATRADGPQPTEPVASPTGLDRTIIIEPKRGLRVLDVGELLEYRDLFRFLVWRSIKVRYAQSAIGIGWAIIQPVFSMIMFTIVFGRLAQIDSEGAPYAIFSFVALVPWTYFSNALIEGTNSLVSEANMISKVYFPRVILPLSAVAAKLLDFAIAMVVLVVLMVWYRVVPIVPQMARGLQLHFPRFRPKFRYL